MTFDSVLYAAVLIGVPLFVAASLTFAAFRTKSKQVRVVSLVVAAMVGAPGLWLIYLFARS